MPLSLRKRIKSWLERTRPANLIERAETCIIGPGQTACQRLRRLAKDVHA
jgi:hypothetical protein